MLDDPAFRNLFRKSPVKRIGRNRFVRNVMIAIGNSGDVSLLPVVEERLGDEAPEVRAMAVWAWAELGGDQAALQALADSETEPDVRTELESALP